MSQDENLTSTYGRIFFAVSSYWFVSITMVFMNKYLLSSPDLKLDAPLFVTWYQCVVTVALCAILSLLSKKFPAYIKFPSFSIDLKIARDIISLSVIFVGMITFNNLCLKYVSVSFYMVVRSLTTIFNVLLTYIFFGERTSFRAMGCCGFIIGGFLLGIDQEKGLGNLSFFGVAYGIAASLFVALNAIYTKKSLNAVDNNLWKLTLYNNFNACILFLPFIFLFDEFYEIMTFPHLTSVYFWFAMTVSGVLGFSMSYVTGLQIQVTSALTHNVSGTAKAYAQTLIAVLYYSEIKTFLWWVSNFFVLIGSGLYTQVRSAEMKQKHVQSTCVSLESGEASASTANLITGRRARP